MKFNDQFDMHTGFLRGRNWIDEIRLNHEGSPFLRALTVYRYKRSDFSGDEWRTSVAWQIHHVFAELICGDLEPFSRDSSWFDFDTGYGHMDAACAGLFPGLFSSQPALHDTSVSSIEFMRKGRLLYQSRHPNGMLPCLVTAGHLPWATSVACDEPLGTDEAWEDMLQLCFQDGCKELAVSMYRLLFRYDEDGKMRDSYSTLDRGNVPLIVRFCSLHLRRGDCGLEDADRNYEVVDGPGPEGAVGWQEYASRSGLYIANRKTPSFRAGI